MIELKCLFKFSADFGFARYVVDQQTKQRQLSETYCGSAAYAAPEVHVFFFYFHPSFLLSFFSFLLFANPDVKFY